jgi:hypothetical protein
MCTAREIKFAIKKLKPKEIHVLADWLQEYRETLWDKQITSDTKSGRLDKLMKEAKSDFKAGRCKLFS